MAFDKSVESCFSVVYFEYGCPFPSQITERASGTFKSNTDCVRLMSLHFQYYDYLSIFAPYKNDLIFNKAGHGKLLGRDLFTAPDRSCSVS